MPKSPRSGFCNSSQSFVLHSNKQEVLFFWSKTGQVALFAVALCFLRCYQTKSHGRRSFAVSCPLVLQAFLDSKSLNNPGCPEPYHVYAATPSNEDLHSFLRTSFYHFLLHVEASHFFCVGITVPAHLRSTSSTKALNLTPWALDKNIISHIDLPPSAGLRLLLC